MAANEVPDEPVTGAELEALILERIEMVMGLRLHAVVLSGEVWSKTRKSACQGRREAAGRTSPVRVDLRVLATKAESHESILGPT
jgi:hypothetical protein